MFENRENLIAGGSCAAASLLIVGLLIGVVFVLIAL